MKTQKTITLIAGLAIVFMSGCACNGPSLLQNPFKDRPVRTQIRSWFQGDACNTCNPPVGITANYGSNVATTCDQCGNGAAVFGGNNFGMTQNNPSLYDAPMINAPVGNGISPIFNQGIQNSAPIINGAVEPAIGPVGEGVLPPSF